VLTIFWHCGSPALSFRRDQVRVGNKPSRVLAEDTHEGVAMLIRSEISGVHGGVAQAAGPEATPAAILSTLLLGGLLLIVP
jgi:hypothetical protein